MILPIIENKEEKKAVLILWKDGMKVNNIRNDDIIKHSYKIKNVTKEFNRKRNKSRGNNIIKDNRYWFDLVSDSAIQLIIGNKIIIGKLKPILLLSKVKLIEWIPEWRVV